MHKAKITLFWELSWNIGGEIINIPKKEDSLETNQR